jgi:CBS domain-containing protein
MGNANQNVPFIKIKIFHRNTDDLIAIRVPPTVSHASLLDKVRERLGNDVVNLRYREEVGSQTPSGAQVVMAGGARLVGVETDEDLERWIRGGSRLVLVSLRSSRNRIGAELTSLRFLVHSTPINEAALYLSLFVPLSCFCV